MILAAIAHHTITGALEGYRIGRPELGEVIPPHVVNGALAADRDEGRRPAAAVKGI